MGKGDKKTRRGKIIKGSYGVKRLRKKRTLRIQFKLSGQTQAETR